MKILIVGCGGIGSWLIHYIIENKIIFSNDLFYLYDFDVVEEKNIRRQNFNSSDINKFKAIVLSNKLLSNGIKAIPIIRTDIVFNEFFDVVILAVDNIEARRHYYNLFMTNKFCRYYIDGGNNIYDGQVFLINNELKNYKNISLIYQHFLDGNDNGSCENNLQTMEINMLIAYGIFLKLKEIKNNNIFENKLVVLNSNGDGGKISKTIYFGFRNKHNYLNIEWLKSIKRVNKDISFLFDFGYILYNINKNSISFVFDISKSVTNACLIMSNNLFFYYIKNKINKNLDDSNFFVKFNINIGIEDEYYHLLFGKLIVRRIFCDKDFHLK